MNKESITYKKYNSFFKFRDKKQMEEQECLKGISKLIKGKDFSNILTDLNGGQILEKMTFDLFSLKKTKNKPFFKLTPNVITEISKIADDRLLEYLVHRYRYEIYPETKKLDKACTKHFPPFFAMPLAIPIKFCSQIPTSKILLFGIFLKASLFSAVRINTSFFLDILYKYFS